jgi:hypothetical protein
MRIKESQFRALIRREIKALLEAEGEDEMNIGTPETGAEEQPEAQPEPEQEEVSKATKMAQKLVERIKQDSELTSAESITDMIVVFMESMGFSNETKLQILRNVKTETVR